ncbi:HAMP domain-containing histidine kinase [Glycomyces sp. A-F 0318]|uniref:sensor histidine kinase n=1 Tax=Glycomyces amatae TaxID=2881355 RepID=UPI001E398A4D|nr:HAMP domain-containing sensor histidine kinase [Glycomyces amatae]MCD0442489.1 HAMP domain-containing histidine kinase [Glycomyces amatae]
MKPTLRARLTLVYGGLFLIGGALLLALTYSLVAQTAPEPGMAAGFYQNTELGGPTETTAPTGPQDDTFVSDKQINLISANVWQEALDAISAQGTIALALVSIATIAIGWLVAGRMLRPLQRVTDTAARIAESPAADRGLHERIEVAGPRDELRELSEAFNRMLERLDHSFDGQRSFLANASHELRTPLTVTKALLEVAVHRRGASAEVRQLGETLLEVNDRHERLVNGLLLLMRSDRELTDRSYVDTADVVEHVVAQTPAPGVAVTAACEEAAVLGETVLLERLVQNLVENAIRYNVPEDGWVRVATRTEDGRAVLEVSNSGPLVPSFEAAGLFEPFKRLGTERLATASKGAGLGLSIVRAIARAHGGEATADPRPEGGLTVTVTLPEAPA